MESEHGGREKVGFMHAHICEARPGVENINGVERHLGRLKSDQRQFATCLD